MTEMETTTPSDKAARTPGGQVIGLIRTMRLRQWVKNGFIFVPLFFDRKLFDLPYLLDTLLGFILFSLVSSTVYLINDLADMEADRAHPKKQSRPLPSGQLSRGLAIAAAIAIPLAALPLSFLLSPAFAAIAASYLVLQLLYTFWLKQIAILDVMSIAAGFVLRVVAGVVLVDVVRFSPWLYLFTTMLALFLGFAKRRQELILLEDEANSHRTSLDQYNIALLDEMIVIVTAVTVLTYSLYTFSAEGLPPNHSMMLTIPFVLYGIFRYLHLIHVKGETAPPDEIALRDRPLQVAIFLWVLMVIAVLYVFG